MSTAEFIRSSLRQQHGMYNDAISDLTEEQLHWRANDKGLPASFILWHYVRTEDNIIQFVLQRKPTVWLERGLNEKFGLPANAQGTGMSHEDAQNLRLEPKDVFYDYMQAVWQATDDFLASTNDEALQEMTTVKPLGEMPVQNAIGNMCLTHGFTHLGEIAHLRGLMGLKGMAV
jgi:hypothetical protein